MAVVKADGYGHGAVAAAKAALRAGADYIGVALLDEALQLREAGVDAPMLVLGHTPPRAAEAAVAGNIALTIGSRDVLDQVMRHAERLDRQARVHLKIDTGMCRFGVQTIPEALALAELALSSRRTIIEGMFTHLADADGEDETFTRQQFRAFTAFMEAFTERNIAIPFRHCCNSAAAVRYPDMHLDMVRVGIALYGLLPSERLRGANIPIRPAMSFKTKVAAVRRIARGQPVGYGGTFAPERDSVIATIPVGYADGLSRQLSNKGSALLRGCRVPIAGRICMDQTMLDATSLPGGVQVGDEVALFGPAGRSGGSSGGSSGDPPDSRSGDRFDGSFGDRSGRSEPVSVDEIADWMGTIPYEAVCLIGKRVPRIYV